MNVIVSNKNEGLLSSLDVDIIKSINGEYTADEIIETFSNFFFNRMFLDITAVKDYKDIANIQKLSIGLEMDKVIFLLTNNLMEDNEYLSKLISMGIYNFASDKESVMYLYNHPNTYKDVANIHQLGSGTATKEAPKKSKFFGNLNNEGEEKVDFSNRQTKVIGFKNATAGAGATTLVYMLKKALAEKDYVVALEVNKNDFSFFNEKDMYSVNQNNLIAAIDKFNNATTILVDLNNTGGESICDEIVYLIEPSIIKLNKMVLVNKSIFDKLYGKKIVLNKSLLGEKDIKDFEYESHVNITYNLPPLNDRVDNKTILLDFWDKINK